MRTLIGFLWTKIGFFVLQECGGHNLTISEFSQKFFMNENTGKKNIASIGSQTEFIKTLLIAGGSKYPSELVETSQKKDNAQFRRIYLGTQKPLHLSK